MREIKVYCPDCKGDGWYSDHADTPHENGCDGECPIQVQCETCKATGKITPKEYNNLLEARKNNSKVATDLPF